MIIFGIFIVVGEIWRFEWEKQRFYSIQRQECIVAAREWQIALANIDVSIALADKNEERFVTDKEKESSAWGNQ